MISHIAGAAPLGVSAVSICAEVAIRKGALRVSIVGLPDTATRESKERLVPAITNSGFALQNCDIVINLSPADLRKEGTAYDLPMAVGILVAQGILSGDAVEQSWFAGELALDGGLRPVRSILPIAECATRHGGQRLFVPVGNGVEGSLVRDLDVVEIEALPQLVRILRGQETYRVCTPKALTSAESSCQWDLTDVKGQQAAKRVLEIAAAGGHNLLFYGPPGSGKSMLSKRLSSILPPMSETEMIEVTRIYSAADLLKAENGPIQQRPFRAPHHTTSPVAMVGGGGYPRPGEVTLAHRGVLFLDELAEFPRRALEVLRQPMEDRALTVCRASARVDFPADFIFVAAMNPCPCGWKGDKRRPCRCSPDRVTAYRDRISGPLLDRIDLQLEMPTLSLSEIRRMPAGESSAVVRARVVSARQRMVARTGCPTITNANMSQSMVSRFCRITRQDAERLEQYLEHLGFTVRGYTKLLRVSRTMADLDGSPHIDWRHLAEAVAYRRFDTPVTQTNLQLPQPAVS